MRMRVRFHTVLKYMYIKPAAYRVWNLDQLAKPIFRSRYAHTPFGSAPVPIILS